MAWVGTGLAWSVSGRLEDGPDVVGDVGHEVRQFHGWSLQGLQLYIGFRQLPARSFVR